MLLVGHNPEIHAFALDLSARAEDLKIGSGEISDRRPRGHQLPGGRLEDVTVKSGKLKLFLTPKDSALSQALVKP